MELLLVRRLRVQLPSPPTMVNGMEIEFICDICGYHNLIVRLYDVWDTCECHVPDVDDEDR